MEILNYEEQSPHSPVIGVFSVRLPAAKMIFHRLKLIRSKKGNLFVSFPAFSTNDEFGEKKYTPFIEMDKDKSAEFQTKVLEALKPFLRE